MMFVMAFMLSLFTEPALLPPVSTQQAKIATAISDTELVAVLQETHIEVFRRRASKGRIAMAWGQIAFENGRGKAVFNHNLGNIGPYKGYPYYKHGLSRFRSFVDFHEAAKVYWELLRDRCSGALASFDAMDAHFTATKLRRCGYHGTEIERYARGLGALLWTGYRLLG